MSPSGAGLCPHLIPGVTLNRLRASQPGTYGARGEGCQNPTLKRGATTFGFDRFAVTIGRRTLRSPFISLTEGTYPTHNCCEAADWGLDISVFFGKRMDCMHVLKMP